MPTARAETTRLTELLRREQHAMAEFLVALSTFDAGRRWEALGYASLFDFLRRELKLSAGAAQNRKSAAGLIARFPEVEAALRRGDLCLSSASQVAKVLTPENAADVLPRFFGKSARDAELVAASIRPVENAPRREFLVTAVRANPAFEAPGAVTPSVFHACETTSAPAAPPLAPATSAGRCTGSEGSSASTHGPPAAVASAPAPVTERGPVPAAANPAPGPATSAAAGAASAAAGVGAQLAMGRVADSASVSRATTHGGGAETKHAPPPPPPPPRRARSRHVPVAVWRGVWERDQGRCVWPLENGGVCGSTSRLELDHVGGAALGAGTTVDECRLLCRGSQPRSRAGAVRGRGHGSVPPAEGRTALRGAGRCVRRRARQAHVLRGSSGRAAGSGLVDPAPTPGHAPRASSSRRRRR